MSKIEPKVDLQKKQIIIPLPQSKLSVAQRLTIERFARARDITSLMSYSHTFNAKAAPHPNSQLRFIRDTKHETTGKNLRADNFAGKPRNTILDKFFEKHDVFANNLKPTDHEETYPKGKMVGIEIECLMPITREEVRDLLMTAPIKNVRCGTDGSVTTNDDTQGYHGMEFRCLTRIDDMSNLKALCDFLYVQGARVNSSCGMHIHLDLRAYVNDARAHSESTGDYMRPPKIMQENMLVGLNLLNRCVPRSRLKNSFCKHDMTGYESADLESRNGRSRGGRYSKINLEAFNKYGTLEVRLHTGTANYQKISQWIKTCYAMAFHPTQIKQGDFPDSLSNEQLALTFQKIFKVEDSTVAYLISRMNAFNPKRSDASEVLAHAKEALDDNENPEKPKDIEEKRKLREQTYRKANEDFVNWISYSRTHLAKKLKPLYEGGAPLKNIPEGLLKQELERQLGIKDGSISTKDFDAFYSSFYMYDKRTKREGRHRLPYLSLYFEQFPDLKKKVLACAKKREAEQLGPLAIPQSSEQIEHITNSLVQIGNRREDQLLDIFQLREEFFAVLPKEFADSYKDALRRYYLRNHRHGIPHVALSDSYIRHHSWNSTGLRLAEDKRSIDIAYWSLGDWVNANNSRNVVLDFFHREKHSVIDRFREWAVGRLPAKQQTIKAKWKSQWETLSSQSRERRYRDILEAPSYSIATMTPEMNPTPGAFNWQEYNESANRARIDQLQQQLERDRALMAQIEADAEIDEEIPSEEEEEEEEEEEDNF